MSLASRINAALSKPLFANFDGKHVLLAMGTAFAGGAWTFLQKDGVEVDPMAFVCALTHWATAKPIVVGSIGSGVASLVLMARKTWLPEVVKELASTSPKT